MGTATSARTAYAARATHAARTLDHLYKTYGSAQAATFHASALADSHEWSAK